MNLSLNSSVRSAMLLSQEEEGRGTRLGPLASQRLGCCSRPLPLGPQSLPINLPQRGPLRGANSPESLAEGACPFLAPHSLFTNSVEHSITPFCKPPPYKGPPIPTQNPEIPKDHRVHTNCSKSSHELLPFPCDMSTQ